MKKMYKCLKIIHDASNFISFRKIAWILQKNVINYPLPTAASLKVVRYEGRRACAYLGCDGARWIKIG